MTTTTHKRGVHIDAPVETVFDYVQEPEHFYEAMAQTQKHPEKTEPATVLTGVTRTPDGAVASYTWKSGGLLGFHFGAVMTREESVPNERIVDHSSTGPLWTYTFEPDQTGTTLSLAFEWSTKVPLVDKAVDRVAWNGDRDLDTMLAHFKKAIEA
jgi:hypothetical protein